MPTWQDTLDSKLSDEVVMKCALDAGYKMASKKDLAILRKLAARLIHEILGDSYLECINYDPYYGECRMGDGSNPKCHPNAWMEKADRARKAGR